MIDKLAAAVVASAGVPLGVLVGHHAAQGLKHRLGDEVLRGDQFELFGLAVGFADDGGVEFGIGLG